LGRAVPKHFAHLSNAIHETSVLIRSPALQCIEKIEQAEETPAKILLHGPTGGGKSVTMLHVLNYAMLKDMVILYVPNPYRFISDHTNTLLKSTWKESRYDQPNVAKTWLDTFRSMNTDFLKNTTTTQEYKWGKRDATPQGKSLLQMLEQGSSRDSYLSDSVGILLKEIRLNKSLNVMFAVDACNGLFTLENSYESIEDSRNLALVEMFQKLLRAESTLNRGAYLFATSRTVHHFKPRVNQLHDESAMELYFDPSSLDQLSDFTRVEVPNYSMDEYVTMMDFYHTVGWLARGKSKDVLEQVDFLTYRNPHAVQQILRSL